MPKQRVAKSATMIDRMALAIAKADEEALGTDPARYRRLAVAALQSLTVPSDAMIEAAHRAVRFDAEWAINNRQDSGGPCEP